MKEGTFDLESDALLEDATVVWCGAVLDHTSGVLSEFRPHQIQELLDYLQTFDVLYAHNGIEFDFRLLRKLYGWEYHGRIVDTLLVSRTIDPNRQTPYPLMGKTGPNSVESWGFRLGDHKVEHEDWSQFSEAMMVRCVQDVRLQRKIAVVLEEEGGPQWTIPLRVVNQSARILARQYDYGWKVDRQRLEGSVNHLTHSMDRITRALIPHLPLIAECQHDRFPSNQRQEKGEWRYVQKPFKQDGSHSKATTDWYADDSSLVGGPFTKVGFRNTDLDKRTEIISYLLAQGWEPKEWNFNKKTGERTSPKLSVDDPFLGVEGKVPTLATKYLVCKQRRGTLEGWLSELGEDDVLHGGWSGLATTGRLKHKLIVNVPGADSFYGRRMRSVFVARQGKVLVGVDSASNQMRQLAARIRKHVEPRGDLEFETAVLSGSSKNGTDLHSLNQRRAGLPNRGMAKNFFYGSILFGAGDAKTAKLLRSTKEAGKALKAAYFSEMPLLRQLLDTLTAQWRANATKKIGRWGRLEYENGWLPGADGRPIYIKSEHTILVYMLQSDEAIQMFLAYCWVYDKLNRKYEWGKDWAFVIHYHDEYVVECRPDIAEEVQAVMERGIEWGGEHLGMLVPHAGTGKIGHSWLDIH